MLQDKNSLNNRSFFIFVVYVSNKTEPFVNQQNTFLLTITKWLLSNEFSYL